MKNWEFNLYNGKTMFKWLFLFSIWMAPLPAQQVSMPPCVVELGTTFFPYPILAGAFAYSFLYQNQWSNVSIALQNQSRQVPALLMAKAARLNPNPFYPVYQPLAVAALLDQTLYEIFASVIRATRTVGESQIQQMYHTIRVQQAARIQACFGPGSMSDLYIRE